MKAPPTEITTIDEYISMFPENVQKQMQKLRKTIKEVAPDAKEFISYKMAAFELYDRHLVYFAGFKSHIGFYPFPSGVKAFEDMAKGYKTSTGTIQFPSMNQCL
jgi:uncharacterized protein YdhG (YjbR/CyaY superfamily)